MADGSKISWTEATWGPTVGCSHCSPGCDRCYAARDAAGRLKNVPVYVGLATKQPGEPAVFTGEVRSLPERLDQPLRWRRPRRIFVDSMSDLFHPGVSDEFIAEVLAVTGIAEHHTFQILTKRPQRMAKLLNSERFQSLWFDARSERAVSRQVELLVQRGVVNLRVEWPSPNNWFGASIESDLYSFRADHVRATPAAVRFLSLEPLLGPLPSLNLDGIDWVIVGGESGSGARKMDLGWCREIVAKCRDAGVPVHVKQLGAAWPSRGHKDLKGGDMASWPDDLQVREWPAA